MLDQADDDPARDLQNFPEDVLTVLVRTLMVQPRRPQALIALTTTCKSLHVLRPADTQKESARDSVAHSLASRRSSADLQLLGILKGAPGTSAQMINTREALRRELVRSGVSSRLERRFSAPELQQRGILRGAGVSSKLSAARELLQRQLAKDVVARTLCERPPMDELHRRGIVRSLPKRSARLASVTAMLERSLLERALAHTLEARPSLLELENRGIMRPRKASRAEDPCSPASRHSM